MHQELSNRNKFCFHIFFRDHANVVLDDDISVPTNKCAFASYKQNADADMCMAILIFDGVKWEYAAMPYRSRDVAEQLGDLVDSNVDPDIIAIPPYNNDSIPVKDRWYKIVYCTGLLEDFPQAKHYPYGEFIKSVIANCTGEILDSAPFMRTMIDYVFNKRKLVGKSTLQILFYYNIVENFLKSKT